MEEVEIGIIDEYHDEYLNGYSEPSGLLEREDTMKKIHANAY